MSQPENVDSHQEPLHELAQRMDEQAASLTSDSAAESDHLSQAERGELERVQFALDFIHRANPTVKQGAPTPVNAQVDRDTPFGAGVTRATGTSGADSSEPARIGSQFGRFTILEQIGEGGFSRVFKALDNQLNRQVALKLLRESLFFSDEVTRRFQREAQAAAILSHPRIVPVFDSGEIKGQHYIASEYCDGETLEQWRLSQADTRLPPRQAAQIVAALADGLEHAHQRGIIHRDLKPANVLVLNEPSSSGPGGPGQSLEAPADRLRVTDFGLAKHAAATDQVETSEGAIVGTPAYMSPEQARGQTEIDARSDIYSLGSILYELLTGRVPVLKDSHLETLIAIKEETPKPPRQLAGKIPRDLESICLKCLQKEPQARYQTAQQLAADLNHWLAGEPIEARRPGWGERSVKWIARNPGFTAAFGLVSGALIVAVFQWQDSVAQRKRADRQLNLSQQVIEEMVTRVAADPDLPATLRRQITQNAADLQQQLLQESDGDLEVRAKTIHAFNRLARLLYDLGEQDAALVAIKKSIELGKPYSRQSPFNQLYASSMQLKSGVLTALNKTEESKLTIEESEANTTPDRSIKIANLFSRGMAHLGAGEFEQASSTFEQSAALFRDSDLTGPAAIPVARTYQFWGRALMEQQKFESALTRTQRAGELLDQFADSNHGRATILEDRARADLQQAEILLRWVDEPDLNEPENLAKLQQSRDVLNAALPRLYEASKLRPLTGRLQGQLVYAYYLLVATEVLGQDFEAADQWLVQMKQVVDNTPKKVHLLEQLAENLIERTLTVADARFEAEMVETALAQQQQAAELLEQWKLEFPESERLQKLEADMFEKWRGRTAQ